MILIKREHPLAKIPTRATEGSAGWDLSSVEGCIVPKGGRRLINTGVSFALPENVYGRIAPRSGLAMKGVHVLAGVCDRSYRASYKVLLFNSGEDDLEVKVGDRIAQVVFEKISEEPLVEVENLDETERGQNGFGSSGV